MWMKLVDRAGQGSHDQTDADSVSVYTVCVWVTDADSVSVYAVCLGECNAVCEWLLVYQCIQCVWVSVTLSMSDCLLFAVNVEISTDSRTAAGDETLLHRESREETPCSWAEERTCKARLIWSIILCLLWKFCLQYHVTTDLSLSQRHQLLVSSRDILLTLYRFIYSVSSSL